MMDDELEQLPYITLHTIDDLSLQISVLNDFGIDLLLHFFFNLAWGGGGLTEEDYQIKQWLPMHTPPPNAKGVKTTKNETVVHIQDTIN
jgi:hypothetical protein